MKEKTVILASKSPRRAELVEYLGYRYETVSFETDETFDSAKSIEDNLMDTAKNKALAVKNNVSLKDGQVIIGVDTVVICNHEVYGKPKDQSDVIRMMESYSASTHQAVSGVCMLSNQKNVCFCVSTDVSFNQMSLSEITQYSKSDEPMDKAGAYAIQGSAAKFIDSINGCYYNVMGFPISKIYEVLKNEFEF